MLKESVILIFNLIIIQCQIIESLYEFFSIPLPPNHNQINLKAGQSLLATCTWSTSSDLDLRLFLGSPNSVIVNSAIGTTPGFQQISYTAEAAEVLFVRTYCYTGCDYSQYKLVLQINGVQAYTVYDSVHTGGIAVKYMTFENACRARIILSGSYTTTIMSNTTGYFLISVNPTQFLINVIGAGKIRLYFGHSYQSNSFFTTQNITINTFSDSKCRTFCEAIPYSNGKAILGTNACNCMPSFVWVQRFNRCKINCNVIKYAVINISDSSCSCQPFFVWSNLEIKCILDCSSITNAIGLTSGMIDQCDCVPSMVWNPLSYTCLVAIDCSVIPYAITNTSLTHCSCTGAFSWNTVTSRCELICSTFSGGNTLVPNTVDQCICSSGYYWQKNPIASATCVACPSVCPKCRYSITYSVVQCTQCITRTLQVYKRNGPAICRQICGDSVTSTLPCDNAKGILLDGCNDYCQIQNDFNCTLIAGVTRCSFNGTLVIDLISFTRKGSFQNAGEIKISIYPPLYAFAFLTNQTLLKQIFSINSDKFSITSISMNANGQVTFSVDLIATMNKGQSFNVVANFNSSSLTDHFFSTKTQSLLVDQTKLKLPIYYYSYFDELTSKIINITSYVIVFLGWISFLVGVFMKRLSGLEAIFVLQFAFLVFIWINNSSLLQFQGIWFFKYSGAYNHSFIQQDLLPSQSVPFISLFKLSKQYFVNNFNLVLLFILFPCIAYFITSLRLRIFLSRNPNLKIDDIPQDTQISQQLEQGIKLSNQYQTSLQILMQGTLFSFIYFLAASVIFFKSSSDITHIPSITILSIYLICIILVMLKFYLDPHPFDYFRYSFRVNLIAINHIFIEIAVILISVLLFTLVSQFSFIALAPPLALSLFTLIFKPYKNYNQNFRSSFNYVTISCFIGMKIYFDYVPSQNFNSIYTNIFLLVNVCLLLPAVLIISIISTIYYWHFYKFVKPRIQQELKKAKQNDGFMKKRKYLKQLNITTVRKKLKSLKQSTIFKKIIPPSINILDYSNFVKDQQFKKQQEQFYKSLTSTRPLDIKNIQNVDQKRLAKHQKIRQQLKLHKQDNKKTKQIAKDKESLGQEQSDKKQARIDKFQQIEISENYSSRKIAEQILNQQNQYVRYKGSVQYTRSKMNKYQQELADKFQQQYNKIYQF